MGLCFCHRASMSLSPPGVDARHPMPLNLSALPAAPRPAKLARPGASDTALSSVPPSTPPPRSSRQRGVTAAESPRQGSGRCPIPKIPDFEGLADSETDSDDELLSHARMRAAGLSASPVPSTPVKLSPGGGVGGNDGTGMSPLTSLISRIGIIGRSSPVRPVTQGRTPESSCSTDDLVAAARRAQVRRLTQKMIQEELQSEQLQQQQKSHHHQPQQYISRSYKRSSMSTIKEDPADISAHDLGHPYNTVSIMDGSSYRTSLEYTFTQSREDLSVPSSLYSKGKEAGTYLLPKPPMLSPSVSSRHSAAQAGKASLPQGIAVRGRPRGGVQGKGPKNSIWASFATDPSARRPLPESASPFAHSATSAPKQAAKTTTGVATKTVSSSIHEAEPQSSLRVKHFASNGQMQGDRKNEKQGTVAHSQSQAVSDSLSSVDEDGSIHEARKARVVVSGQLRSSSNRLDNIVDVVTTADNAGAPQRTSSPLVTAVTKFKKSSRRKTSESSHISSLDLPPPLVNILLGSGDTANADTQPTCIAGTDNTATPGPPSHNGLKRLPFLSLDRFGFGLRKSSNTDLPAQKSASAEESKLSASLRNTVSGSVASLGVQLDGQIMDGSGRNDRDSESDKSQYHSMTSATLKVWAEDSPPTQSELKSGVYGSSQAAARATTTDIEIMAEEWHQQIQRLDRNSPYLSDSWWSEPKWQEPEPKEAPSGHEAVDPIPTTKATEKDLPNEKEVVSPLSPIKSENTVVHNEAPSPEPEPSYSRVFSSGIEKAIRAGFKKVMYRKQASTPSLAAAAAVPAAAASSRSLNPQPSTTASHSKASSLNVEKGTPASRAAAPVLESRPQETASESPQTPRHKDDDLIQDIDSIFGVLVNMESNQRSTPVTPVRSQQNKVDKGSALLESENEVVSPQTVPSTPIANAYAEVRAYISAVLPGTPARRVGVQDLHNSPISPYQEAASHQGSDAVCATTQANVKVASHKSLDSMSVKSDSVPVKKAAEADNSSNKYMTWNGSTVPKATVPVLKSTTQFSTDLENIFLGKKENRKAFQDHTLQPAVEQN
ncbi:hypothetical protein Sste5346_004458 [Sporothrix stenoceras]|uniref:Uncharacterized protein n=1 Tax=Sporothrix stenoceras TaxID=5173 RepID=A0ABR3Z8Z4_9PEZI